MKRSSWCALIVMVLSCGGVRAEPLLPDETRRAVNSVIDQAVNAVTIFTSDNSLSAGHFTIDNGDEPDSDFYVTKIPGTSTFGAEGDLIRPYLEGNVALFRAVERFPPVNGAGENDFSRLESIGLGGGGGLKIAIAEGVLVDPSFSAHYSRVENHFDYHNQFSTEVLKPYGKQLYGWTVDTMTYSPALKFEYQRTCGTWRVTAWTEYAHFFNNSFRTDSPTIDVSSNTGLWQKGVGVVAPLHTDFRGRPMSTRFQLGRSDVYRSARKGLDVGYFYDFTWDLLFDFTGTSQPFKTLFVGANYSIGEDLTGWRVGFGYEF